MNGLWLKLFEPDSYFYRYAKRPYIARNWRHSNNLRCKSKEANKYLHLQGVTCNNILVFLVEKVVPVKVTVNGLVSVPYSLVASQMYFPFFFKRMVAVLVVLTSISFLFLFFLMSAVYMGGVPVAEHDSL